MLRFILSLIAAARAFFQSRTDLAVEVLALRQQVAVLKRRRPRPPLRPLDRLFWTVLGNVGSLERCARHREARDSRQMASRRIPLLLALAIPAARRTAADGRRSSSPHPAVRAR